MMIDKDWDAIPYVDGDCIRDENEWNDMITYVKHSAADIFTIYDDEDSTNQIFKFTHTGVSSQMYGGNDAGDILYLYSNSINTSPYIKLIGGGDFECVLSPSDNFKIFDAATEALRISYAGNMTYIEGGAVTGDDSIYKANSIDAFPKITLFGNSHIYYYASAACKHMFFEGASTFLALFEDGTDEVIEGQTADNDIYLKPNGTGVVKFGTYAASTITHTGYITMKDAGGTNRLVMIGEV